MELVGEAEQTRTSEANPAQTINIVSPVDALREYLSCSKTASARALAEKAMVLVHPRALLGRVVWPLTPWK